MASTDFKSVDAYLAAQPETMRVVLDQVRIAIRKALPDAEEVIAYQIPAYRLHGANLIYFAGWKRHYSIYPIGAETTRAFAGRLAPYEVNDKGTARFPLTEPAPTVLIADMARHLAAAAEERARIKAATRRR